MSEEEATNALNELNLLPNGRAPWNMTFSFGRALQQSCLKIWQGQKGNSIAAQSMLLARAKANSQATMGKYVMK